MAVVMVDKLHKYEGFHGQFHRIRETAKQKIEQWKEDYPGGKRGIAMNILKIDHSRGPPPPKNDDEKHDRDHDYIFRRKTRSELVRISAAVMGIEFSYAAETAFVSPTLLKIGVTHKLMTMVWGLSPLLGFFMTPILGSLSDRCTLALGRRRPFILILSLGVFLGLILVPNGESLGYALGDFPPILDLNDSMTKYPLKNLVTSRSRNATLRETPDVKNFHPWGVFFTILGTVLLDFNADSCQSPARAYLLDVSSPEDHARGLSTFTIMAGLGGFFGYAMGGINWDITFVGEYLGGHVRAVFSLITILFVVCVFFTVTSFKEIPLKSLKDESKKGTFKLKEEPDFKKNSEKEKSHDYGAFRVTPTDIRIETNDQGIQLKLNASPVKETQDLEPLFDNPSLKEYLLSIVFMPRSLRIVCLTNLFCWMSHVCYSLYFTDFVGEAVFNGDPLAPKHSREYELYEEGVRFGCWGMSMYSLSCSCYSLIIEGLIHRYSAKKVYVGGLAFYSAGMMLMAMIRNKIGVILFSWTAGVMYSTLFTMPYLLVAHYHANGVFELTKEGEVKIESRQRGLGTDVGIVSSMVFLAQFILALAMGEIVSLTRTTTAVVSVASFLAFCGAITATKVMYLHL